jgi:hypothetical protein
MIFPFGDISVPVACPIGRFDVARETGERVQEIGTADDANKLLAANNRQPLDSMFLHHSHDLIERRLFGDGNGIGRHNLAHLASVGAGRSRPRSSSAGT